MKTRWKQLLRRSRRGTSLVEIMVVMAIVLTLMAVTAWGVMSIYGSSKQQTTEMQMARIADAVQLYVIRKRRAPELLADAFPGVDVPVDAWDHPFRYVPRGKSFELSSLGADGAEGGTGLDADLRYEGGRGDF